jgi:hypothetical protein
MRMAAVSSIEGGFLIGLSQTPADTTLIYEHMASKASLRRWRSKSSCIYWTFFIFKRVMKPLACLYMVRVAFTIIISTC